MSATNRGAKRALADFYATPEESFLPLLQYLPMDSVFWEPALGDGRLVRLLRNSGRDAGGADLHPMKPGAEPVDFLRDPTQRDFIITNPPFSLAKEFVTHAVNHSRETVLLLRLNFLGSKKRRTWWRDYKPNALFVLSDRPDFTGEGGDACDYAWFYWGRRWQGIYFL